MLKQYSEHPVEDVVLESSAVDLLDAVAYNFRDFVDELANQRALERHQGTTETITISADDVRQVIQELRETLSAGHPSNPYIGELSQQFLAERD